MFHNHTLAAVHTHIKPADDDMQSYVVQVASCPPHRGFNYTGNLSIFSINMPVDLSGAISVTLQLLSREIQYARYNEVLLTLCDTATPIDHYVDTSFKYYFIDVANLKAVVSAWIALVHLRPILKVIRRRRGYFSMSLQVYTKKQLWVDGFAMDMAYLPRPLQL